MSIRPEIRAQVPPRDRAIRCPLNGYGKNRATTLFPGKDLVQGSVTGKPEPPQKLGHRDGVEVSNVHAIKDMFAANRVKPQSAYSLCEHMAQPEDMEIWPQRPAFSARLKEFQDRTGKTQAEVAVSLGMSLSSLRQVLYQKSRRASFETCQKAAGLFGCSVTEFVDDPGSNQELVELTDQERFWANTMLQDFKAEDLTMEDRRILAEDFKRGLDNLRLLKMRLGK